MKLKKNDEIIITGGKDKGRKGKIETVLPKAGKVIVLGLNISKRHMKKRDEKSPAGIIDIPKPISLNKVALICPKCKKTTRVGFLVTGKEKVRICRKCKQTV